MGSQVVLPIHSQNRTAVIPTQEESPSARADGGGSLPLVGMTVILDFYGALPFQPELLSLP
jgi:hypothetical protein